MTVRIQLPPLLRTLSGGARTMEANGASIAAAMSDLCARHPPFALHVFDESGHMRPNIVFLHDGMLVRGRDAGDHRVRDGDEIVLTNALAGG